MMPVTQRAILPEADVPQTDEDSEALLEAEAEVANPKNVTDQCELVEEVIKERSFQKE